MKKITKNTIDSLDNLYNFVELIIAYILVFSAIGLIFFSVYEVIIEFLEHRDTVKIVVTLIHHLLLIMIILEILWTVIHYMKTKKLSVEAFIIIAIISSVRKILVISASQSVADSKSASIISSLTTESFAQGLIVLIMVIAIFILRKSRLFLKELDEE
ncbi:conserved hypothetical protein [Thermotomaculum hydrothermale]|uniref:Phosphate-starvation-inducible E-like protein n=1 Tax=Thermotomaculum hydrothermale TaxID=981385 RepID=A0A7R6SZ41_9BACT|nr:phosphate-starvation-inducible PsiE family protein [Thermotomaculum hydrothermale]BBB32430.1 conserved hypothetical protein [Thermotomaculum hydrothermale]